MTSIVGFLGLILNLTSMTMKDIVHLRVLSLVANSVYFVYGCLISAAPILIGSLVAVGIHAIALYKMKHPINRIFKSR